MGIESQEGTPHVRAELPSLTPEVWEGLKEDIVRIENECFGDTSLTEEDFQNIVQSPDAVLALLKKGSYIVGFTLGGPDETEDSEKTITIYSTAISPSEQGKGYVASLMQVFEGEARKRGYVFLTRYAAKGNGYADKVQENYAERIVNTSEHDSEMGPQRYFKIKL